MCKINDHQRTRCQQFLCYPVDGVGTGCGGFFCNCIQQLQCLILVVAVVIAVDRITITLLTMPAPNVANLVDMHLATLLICFSSLLVLLGLKNHCKPCRQVSPLTLFISRWWVCTLMVLCMNPIELVDARTRVCT